MYSNKNRILEPLRDKPVADTPDGTAWCLKALHPADHELASNGMPTEDASPMVTMQYLQETLISPPVGLATDTWDLDVWFLRDPVTFGCYQAAGADGSSLTTHAIYNTQLMGAEGSVQAGWVAMCDNCEQFRISYAGITGHLVANALSNQGTVRAAQYPYPAYIRPVMRDVEITPDTSSSMYGALIREAVTYPDPLIPYSSLIQMPQCYQENAVEGFYMPLKMAESDESYKKTNQVYALLGRVSDTSTWNQEILLSSNRWPWYDDTVANYPFRGCVPGENIGHVAFRGLSKDASVNLIFRYGVDMKVRPATTFAPFQHEPPVYDQTAFKMYYEIARRMADAYPASYNAAGTLLTVVGKIAEQIWPLVVPHAQKLLNKLKDKIENAVRKKGETKQLPAPAGGGTVRRTPPHRRTGKVTQKAVPKK